MHCINVIIVKYYSCFYFVCCLGKSGAVGKRLAASLSSVGVAATFVHAAEWGHGDLGGQQPEYHSDTMYA